MRRSAPVLFSMMVACASAGEPRPPRSRAPSEQTPGGTLEAAPREVGWGRIRIVSRALELELPNSAAWRYRPGKTNASWVSLEHAPTGSSIELWTAPAGRLVLPKECEERARLRRPELFLPTPENTVSHEVLSVPSGYRSELTLGVSAESTDPSLIVGELVLFGAAPLHCLAVHYVTRVRGDGATEEVARRLDLVAHRVIPSLTFRSVDARVPPPVQR